MPKVTIIAIGKTKEEYQRKIFQEYKKRLSRFIELNLIEIEDLPLPDKLKEGEKEQILIKEGRLAINKIPKGSYVFVLDVNGKEIDSLTFANKIDELFLLSKNHLTFIIGGSLGVSSELISISDYRLSLSKMTFTHLMTREILLEQLYRAMKINHGEKYHK